MSFGAFNNMAYYHSRKAQKISELAVSDFNVQVAKLKANREKQFVKLFGKEAHDDNYSKV